MYNLSVEDEHEYFANGVLVHNCDASLYAHRASYQYRHRPEDKPPVVGSSEYYRRQAAELEEAADEYDPSDWRNRGIA